MDTIEWYSLEPGRYSTKYMGHHLEVIRSDNPHEGRRYLPIIDGKSATIRYWTTKDVKRAALRLAEGMNARAVPASTVDPPVPEPAPPAPKPAAPPEWSFRITGRLNDGAALPHFQALVQLIRELGADVEGEIVPPARVAL